MIRYEVIEAVSKLSDRKKNMALRIYLYVAMGIEFALHPVFSILSVTIPSIRFFAMLGYNVVGTETHAWYCNQGGY